MPCTDAVARIIRRLLPVVLAVAATGCASVTVSRPDRNAQDYSIDEFRAYVEQVFRYQNRVVDELIVYYADLPAEDPAPDPDLVAAEEASVAACQPLNEVITSYIHGDDPALGLKRALVATIGTCEYQVDRLDRALGKL